MKRILVCGVCLAFLMVALRAQQSLPIKRILLYKNGMAYLVRSGTLQQPYSLSFHPEDMKDVLKTFTAWNPSTERLYSLGYTTGVPLEQVLGQFPFTLDNSGGLAGFLSQMQGAELALTRGSSVLEGKLVTLTPESRAVDRQTLVKDYLLSLLDSEGTLQKIWLSEADSLALKDPELSRQLRSYLEALAEGKQDVTREITIYPVPQAGPVQVAYVQQFPVWKTSYRVEIAGAEATLQGWAQVDNPIGEAWDDVDLTLVSGMPVSFIMDLYQPLYTSRSTLPVPGAAMAVPRSYETAVSTRTTARSGSAGAANEDGLLQGRASIMAARKAGDAGLEIAESMAPSEPDFVQAEAAQVQDSFEYRFPFSVSLPARQSALLPFLKKKVTVEKVSIFNPVTDRNNPLSGLWLENSTGVPLEAGPITLFSEGRYSGEAVLEHLSREERRLISYGVDYEVEVAREVKLEPETLAKMTINRGTLIFQRERIQATLYQLRNKSRVEKTVLIEHPRQAGRGLQGVRALETTPNYHRFQVTLQAEAEVDFPVREVLSREITVAIGDLNRQQLQLSLAGRELPQGLRRGLEEVMTVRERLSLLETEQTMVQQQVQSISRDQGRLRENLKVLRTSEEERLLRQRYLDQLNQQENRLQELSLQAADLEEKIRAAQQELSERIGRLSGSIEF